MYTSSSTLSCICIIDTVSVHQAIHSLYVSLHAIVRFDFYALHLRNLRVLLQSIIFPAIDTSV